jgi:hypothetical protein
MSKKPWLRKGLTLDQRIELGLPVVMERIQPEKAAPSASQYKYRWQHVEECRNLIVSGIRQIAERDADRVTWRTKRKAIVNAAAKVRAAQKALEAVPYSVAEVMVCAIADELEADAKIIPTGRTGASRQARTDKARKDDCVFLAFQLHEFGKSNLPFSTTKHKFFDYLVELLFQIATGRRGSVTKAIKAFFKKYGFEAVSVDRRPEEASEERYAEWNQPPPD